MDKQTIRHRKGRRRGNCEGSIYQRTSDLRWVGQLMVGRDENNKPIRIYTYGDTQAEVEKALITKKYELLTTGTIQRNIREEKNGYTFQTMIEDWFSTVRIIDCDTRTIENLRYKLKHILKQFSSYKLDDITTYQCQLFFNSLLKQYSTDYVKRIYSLFHGFMKYCLKQKLTNTNPLEDVVLRRPKNKQGKERERDAEIDMALAPEIRESFFRCLDNAEVLKPIIYTYTFASLRPGELPPLKWKHFNYAKKTLTIRNSTGQDIEFDDEWNVVERKQKIQSTKTNLSVRTNYLPQILVDVLVEWYHHQKKAEKELGIRLTAPDDFMFPTRTGTLRTYSSIRSMLQRFLVKNNLPDTIHLYTFRHTCATLLLERKENPKVVQKIMGHKKVEQTLGTYSHVLNQTIFETAAEALDTAYKEFDECGKFYIPPLEATDIHTGT